MNENVIFGLVGPTASGKTRIGVLLAKEINAEIINVDSVQIYKRLNIGSAKPTLIETNDVIHHMLDIIEPWDLYSAQRFLIDVKKCISTIRSRNKNVLLVGGAMLYFKLLIEGISILPSFNQKMRIQLNNQSLNNLLSFLIQHDPITAKSLSCKDRCRIQRIVEIMLITKKPYSVLMSQYPRLGGLGNKIKLCAIVPRYRYQLYDNIASRFYSILKQGFISEVSILKSHKWITRNLTSMKSIGYFQALQYLYNVYNYNDFVTYSIIATRQFAKNQLNWIRNWPHFIKIFEYDNFNELNIELIFRYFLTISVSSK